MEASISLYLSVFEVQLTGQSCSGIVLPYFLKVEVFLIYQFCCLHFKGYHYRESTERTYMCIETNLSYIYKSTRSAKMEARGQIQETKSAGLMCFGWESLI